MTVKGTHWPQHAALNSYSRIATGFPLCAQTVSHPCAHPNTLLLIHSIAACHSAASSDPQWCARGKAALSLDSTRYPNSHICARLPNRRRKKFAMN